MQATLQVFTFICIDFGGFISHWMSSHIFDSPSLCRALEEGVALLSEDVGGDPKLADIGLVTDSQATVSYVGAQGFDLVGKIKQALIGNYFFDSRQTIVKIVQANLHRGA
jgi:hypothetical protein